MSSKTASIEDVVGSETGAVEQDLIMGKFSALSR